MCGIIPITHACPHSQTKNLQVKHCSMVQRQIDFGIPLDLIDVCPLPVEYPQTTVPYHDIWEPANPKKCRACHTAWMRARDTEWETVWRAFLALNDDAHVQEGLKEHLERTVRACNDKLARDKAAWEENDRTGFGESVYDMYPKRIGQARVHVTALIHEVENEDRWEMEKKIAREQGGGKRRGL